MLNAPMLKALVMRACETNDVAFLVKLGRKLSKKPESVKDSEYTLIRILLLNFWNDPRYGQPLCRLTDEALTEFCKLALQMSRHSLHGVSFAQVRKIRARLKLKKGAQPYFKIVRLSGDSITIS